MKNKYNKSDLNDAVLKLIKSIISKCKVDNESDFITNSYDKFLKTLACHVSSASYRDTYYMIEKIKQMTEKNKSEKVIIVSELLSKLKLLMLPQMYSCFIILFFELSLGASSKYNHFRVDVSFKHLKIDDEVNPAKFNEIKTDDLYNEGANINTSKSILNSYPNDITRTSMGQIKNKESTNFIPPINNNRQTFISKEVLASLGKDPSTNPWMLISERLQNGCKESDLVSELLCVLQGIDNSLITYNINTEQYSINTTVNMLTNPVRDLILKICELGWLYRQLNNFINEKKLQNDYGMVGQAFVLSFKSYLDDHIHFIASVDSDLLMNISTSSDGFKIPITLPGLMMSTLTCQRKFIYLYDIFTSCKGVRGGALLSLIHKNTITGDPMLSTIGKSLLRDASKPINCLLTEWIYQGNLTDTYSEFFIACNNSVKKDKLWSLKYTTRESMIPSFLSSNLVAKILRIGKSINFIKSICESKVNLKINYCMLNIGEVNDKNTEAVEQIGSLREVIEEVDSETSKYLLDILNQKYKIYLHIEAIHRYLLLGQGDFIRHLMDLLKPYLSSKADSLRLNSITSVLESAINSTNAQFDDKEVLERLDCKIAEASPSDLGWDVFTLYYHTRGPLQTIVDSNSMENYLKIFHFLWFLKRTVYLLSDLSKDQIAYSKQFKYIEESENLLHPIYLLKTEMIHFINQLEYFITFEVLECSKVELKQKFNEAKDLDDVIKAHNTFLKHITSMCLLNENSELILCKLKSIFAAIIHFESVFRSVISYLVEQADLRKLSSSSSLSTTPSSPSPSPSNLIKNKTTHFNKANGFYSEQIKNMRTSYRKMMNDFLVTLIEKTNGSHYSLCFRLDFNEFYTKQSNFDKLNHQLTRRVTSFFSNDKIS